MAAYVSIVSLASCREMRVCVDSKENVCVRVKVMVKVRVRVMVTVKVKVQAVNLWPQVRGLT